MVKRCVGRYDGLPTPNNTRIAWSCNLFLVSLPQLSHLVLIFCGYNGSRNGSLLNEKPGAVAKKTILVGFFKVFRKTDQIVCAIHALFESFRFLRIATLGPVNQATCHQICKLLHG